MVRGEERLRVFDPRGEVRTILVLSGRAIAN